MTTSRIIVQPWNRYWFECKNAMSIFVEYYFTIINLNDYTCINISNSNYQVLLICRWNGLTYLYYGSVSGIPSYHDMANVIQCSDVTSQFGMLIIFQNMVVIFSDRIPYVCLLY